GYQLLERIRFSSMANLSIHFRRRYRCHQRTRFGSRVGALPVFFGAENEGKAMATADWNTQQRREPPKKQCFSLAGAAFKVALSLTRGV
ncbi:MAG: hypothetical protein ABFC73_09600, partial [Clostridiaceae bacterium]